MAAEQEVHQWKMSAGALWTGREWHEFHTASVRSLTADRLSEYVRGKPGSVRAQLKHILRNPQQYESIGIKIEESMRARMQKALGMN